MLRRTSDEIREALEHADDMAQRAAEATSEEVREAFLLCEHSWRKLAHSLDFSNRLNAVVEDIDRRDAARRVVNQVQLYRPLCSRCGSLTTLVASQPDQPGHDLRTFQCDTCGHVESAACKID